jgi:DNA-binding response OmpR family regulator
MPPPAVLVVDDNQELRHFLVNALRLLDFLPISARSGVEALNLFPAYARVIDFALIDQHLSTLGGLTTLHELRRFKPSLRCCIMGSAVCAEEESILAAGAVCVLPKPFTLTELADCMRRLLGRS